MPSNPNTFDELVMSASMAVQKGDFDGAIRLAKQAIELRPNESTGYSILGRCFLSKREPDLAIENLGRAVALDPGEPVLFLLFAQALQASDRDWEAVEAYRRAIELAPKSVDGHIALGQLQIKLGNRDDAASSFRRAYRLEPNTPRGLVQFSKALLEEGNFAEAEAHLRRAISIDGRSPIPHSLLGQVLQQLGRFGEAAEELTRAIAIQPSVARPYFLLVQCQRLTEADRPLVERIAALLASPNLSSDDRRLLHYALGKALDDLGDYEQAIGHFDAANKIMLRLAGPSFDRGTHSAQFDLAIQNLTPEFVQRNLNVGSDSEEPVFIVGMIRSGTTLVEQIVSSHPEVGAGGELRFWLENTRMTLDSTQTAVDPQAIPAVAEEYLSLLESAAPGKRRVTDKMPLNFMFLGVLHMAFPHARIIHCRRNPIDNGLSMYITPFAQPASFLHSRENIVFYYEEYRRLMEHWRQILPNDRFLEVDYESIVADREGETRKIVEFLGLEWSDACLKPESNDRTVSTPSMWQVRQPIYRTSVDRWRNYEPWLGELRTLGS